MPVLVTSCLEGICASIRACASRALNSGKEAVGRAVSLRYIKLIINALRQFGSQENKRKFRSIGEVLDWGVCQQQLTFWLVASLQLRDDSLCLRI